MKNSINHLWACHRWVFSTETGELHEQSEFEIVSGSEEKEKGETGKLMLETIVSWPKNEGTRPVLMGEGYLMQGCCAPSEDYLPQFISYLEQLLYFSTLTEINPPAFSSSLWNKRQLPRLLPVGKHVLEGICHEAEMTQPDLISPKAAAPSLFLGSHYHSKGCCLHLPPCFSYLIYLGVLEEPRANRFIIYSF